MSSSSVDSAAEIEVLKRTLKVLDDEALFLQSVDEVNFAKTDAWKKNFADRMAVIKDLQKLKFPDENEIQEEEEEQ